MYGPLCCVFWALFCSSNLVLRISLEYLHHVPHTETVTLLIRRGGRGNSSGEGGSFQQKQLCDWLPSKGVSKERILRFQTTGRYFSTGITFFFPQSRNSAESEMYSTRAEGTSAAGDLVSYSHRFTVQPVFLSFGHGTKFRRAADVKRPKIIAFTELRIRRCLLAQGPGLIKQPNSSEGN